MIICAREIHSFVVEISAASTHVITGGQFAYDRMTLYCSSTEQTDRICNIRRCSSPCDIMWNYYCCYHVVECVYAARREEKRFSKRKEFENKRKNKTREEKKNIKKYRYRHNVYTYTYTRTFIQFIYIYCRYYVYNNNNTSPFDPNPPCSSASSSVCPRLL